MMKPNILFWLFLMAFSYPHGHAHRFPVLPANEIFSDDFSKLCEDNFSLRTGRSDNGLDLSNDFFNSEKLVCLDLSNTKIVSIGKKVFEGLPNLKYAKFQGGPFKTSDFFNNGHNVLEVLILSGLSQYFVNEGYYGRQGFSQYRSHHITVKGDYPKLRKLILTSSSIETLNVESDLQSLTHLDLSHTGMSSNQLDWLPSSLEYLNLKYTRVSNLKIENVSNLKWLSLSSYNSDHAVQSVLIDNVPSLHYLSLSACGIISTTPISISGAKNLTIVDLSQNKISYLNLDILSGAPNIGFLNLSGNVELFNISPADTPILQGNLFSRLTDLDLSGTKFAYLKWLPSTIENLFIQGSGLKSIEISSLLGEPMSNLRYVDFSNNKISHINHTAAKDFKNLLSLNLSSNAIKTVEAAFLDELADLQFLNLENNLIAEIPRVGRKIKLDTLLLNCNQLKHVRNETFSNMNGLKYLFLHKNSIDKIEPKGFAGLELLEILTLSYNQLSYLPKDWSLPLANLQSLDLSGNSFLSLSSLQLNSKSSLRNLYLSTQFAMLEFFAIRNLPENVTIHIDPKQSFVKTCEARNQRSY